jgi:uncharacterized membrane protein
MSKKTRLLALVASVSAVNVVFRFALAWEPFNVKPIAFLTIVAAVIGGPLAGLAVGWLSMSVSDIVGFGAGIWTLETSSFMAIVGLIAGVLWQESSSFNRWQMAAGGFLLTMVFDLGTSIIDAVLFSYPWIPAVLALYVPFLMGSPSPYPFGLAHELTTAILLSSIGPSVILRIRRIYQQGTPQAG